jgi:hypothetical protein
LASDLVEQPPERLNKEIRRRTDVVGIFPTGPRSSAWPALSEQTDEWTESRRYMGLDLLNKARLAAIDAGHTNPPATADTEPAPIAAKDRTGSPR